jgi:hypothetical protein
VSRMHFDAVGTEVLRLLRGIHVGELQFLKIPVRHRMSMWPPTLNQPRWAPCRVARERMTFGHFAHSPRMPQLQ